MGGDVGIARHGCKFAISDMVTTKVPSDIKMMVVAQQIDICNGGVQIHYTCRAYIKINNSYRDKEPHWAPAEKLGKHNEIELKAL